MERDALCEQLFQAVCVARDALWYFGPQGTGDSVWATAMAEVDKAAVDARNQGIDFEKEDSPDDA